MTICPHCGSSARQVRAGMHGGSQRFKCMSCLRRYTPEPLARGYPDHVRREALTLFAQGFKPRQIARRLGMTPQTVSNWVASRPNIALARQPNASPPASPEPAASPAPIKRKTTIGDVAERARVSVATVSNYLNDKGRMGDAARSRIQAAMADLHFTPSALTRAIRRRRTKILGIMMFDLSSLDQNVGTAVAPQMLAGVNTEAFEAAHNILLYTGLQYRPQYQAGAEFLDGHIDGLIWVAREMKEPILERVAAAGLPTVALLTRHVPAGIGFIDAENVAGSRAMVRHLAGRGHRRIAYAGSVHSSNVIDRLEGYRQGLRDSGLPYDPALESADNALRSSADAYARALDRWLALPEPPTAIMLQNDRAAAMLLPAIQARGLRVPEDIAVAGFDDAPDAQWLGGGLTTQRQPFAQMGRLAVKNLIALIEDAPAEACRLIIPTELVIRASTGGA